MAKQEQQEQTNFADDFKTGDIGVNIFLKNFVRGQRYTYSSLEDKELYDLSMNGTRYEIKCNYHDDGILFIEEWTNEAKHKPGWIKTTKSDYVAFVSKRTETILLYPTKQLHNWYKENYQLIKKRYTLHKNKRSKGLYGDEWVSSYRAIPRGDIPFFPIVLVNPEPKGNIL